MANVRVQGIIFQDSEGQYSLWTEGIPDDISDQIIELLEPYVNEGGSTSPCDTLHELFEDLIRADESIPIFIKEEL